MAQFGYGTFGSIPGDDWQWVNASYNGDAGANDELDEYYASVTIHTAGTYSYAYRYSIDEGATWIYADLDGNNLGSNFTNGYSPSKAGTLTVTDVTKADLIVESLETSPKNPDPGEDITIDVRVRNKGTADAGTFYTDFYVNLSSPPLFGERGDIGWELDTLPAGETHTFNDTISYQDIAEFYMYVQVDTDEQIEEINETDNVLGPISIKVGACKGDFDDNGIVDEDDLIDFVENYGKTGCTGDCKGDFDGNGFVDGLDLVEMINDFGRPNCP
jgi:hypothetical protein